MADASGAGQKISALAGKPAPQAMLVDVPQLVAQYYAGVPDPSVPSQRVVFGTSGHRGSSLELRFNEAHVLAITQAICDYRKQQRHRRTAVPRHRYACAVGAGLRERAGSAGRATASRR